MHNILVDTLLPTEHVRRNCIALSIHSDLALFIYSTKKLIQNVETLAIAYLKFYGPDHQGKCRSNLHAKVCYYNAIVY